MWKVTKINKQFWTLLLFDKKIKKAIFNTAIYQLVKDYIISNAEQLLYFGESYHKMQRQ